MDNFLYYIFRNLILLIMIFSACFLFVVKKSWNSDRKHSRINVHFDKHKEHELRRR
jgi:hypothetical protein